MKSEVLSNFVSEVIKNNHVFALGLDGGFAKSYSNFFTNDDDEQIEVFCFWSQNQLATECIKEDWEDYTTEVIQLGTFMEDWCVGMSNENYGVGINFTESMEGAEADPLELLLEICEQLLANNQEPKMVKFKKVSELKKHVVEALNYED